MEFKPEIITPSPPVMHNCQVVENPNSMDMIVIAGGLPGLHYVAVHHIVTAAMMNFMNRKIKFPIKHPGSLDGSGS